MSCVKMNQVSRAQSEERESRARQTDHLRRDLHHELKLLKNCRRDVHKLVDLVRECGERQATGLARAHPRRSEVLVLGLLENKARPFHLGPARKVGRDTLDPRVDSVRRILTAAGALVLITVIAVRVPATETVPVE